MQIAYAVPTPAPATPLPAALQTPEPTFQPSPDPKRNDAAVGRAYKSISNIVMPILVLVGVLLLAAVALLAIAAKKRADQKRASEAAYDHLERAKRRDYVTPNEEDEQTKAKVLGIGDDLLTTADPELGIDEDELPHMKYVRNAMERSGRGEYGESTSAQDDPLDDIGVGADYAQNYTGYAEDYGAGEAPYGDETDGAADANEYANYGYPAADGSDTEYAYGDDAAVDGPMDEYTMDDRMADVPPTAVADDYSGTETASDYAAYAPSAGDGDYRAATGADEYSANTETGRRRRTRSAYPPEYHE